MYNSNNNMIFRPAAEPDASSIARINQQHWHKFDNPRGFLLKQITVEHVMANLAHFWVVDIDNNVAAYIEIAPIFADYETHLWFNYVELNWVIGTVANVLRITQLGVDQAHQQSRVGSFAVARLRELFPHSIFITALICKPTLNRASLAFHLKNGFRPVAYGIEREFEKLFFLNP
ncbi:MAG: GNAT family N-acetyltransferase [Acidobacteriota bacterium]